MEVVPPSPILGYGEQFMVTRVAKSFDVSRLGDIFQSLLIPVLAILTALFVASGIILLAGSSPIQAYVALVLGALGNIEALINTLIKAVPLIITGLGVTVAFRGGLFNIGVEGQLFVGSIVAVIVGTIPQFPAPIHGILTILAGTLAGALWALIPGVLKARYGASEVITTLMMNYIATRIISWSIGARGPLRPPISVVPETRALLETARLPNLMVVGSANLHLGIVIAIVIIGVIYVLLFRTTLGLEIRIVGINMHAAKYAGISVKSMVVLTMLLSGGLAGLAGAVQVMGLPPYKFTTGFNVGTGFDSIAVAVLGNIHPLGVMFSALLFGAMESGARLMQLRARVPIELITVLQGLILMFVAADKIIRDLYRIRTRITQGEFTLAQSWSSGKD